MEQGYAALNGTRLYYEVAGAGAPVALAHGFTLDHRMWDEQFSALAERYRVVRYDLRGFGRSEQPTDAPYAHHDDLRSSSAWARRRSSGSRWVAALRQISPWPIPS